jgi:hypothetical protein
MADRTRWREERRLKVRKEPLRVLDVRELDVHALQNVAGGGALGRCHSRYCVTGW